MMGSARLSLGLGSEPKPQANVSGDVGLSLAYLGISLPPHAVTQYLVHAKFHKNAFIMVPLYGVNQ